jgi:Gas vesicle synthesis protein GvpL/GvpF
MTEEGLAVYVYCVVEADEEPSFGGADAVNPGSRVECVRSERLSAVVSQVSLDEFSEEALRRNFEDMAWLERVARSHQAVLKRALELCSVVVPMRLCTVFGDEGQVRAMLERERGLLVEAIDRVRDHSEWSVKVLADPRLVEAAARAQSAEAASDTGPGGAGHAYLARRQVERGLRERSRELVEAAAEDIYARLQDQAEAVALLPPQNRELSGRRGEMVLNAAYLVHRSHVRTFLGLVEELRVGQQALALGLEVESSGPWAPYNFVGTAQPV